jgi:hypothetical protein
MSEAQKKNEEKSARQGWADESDDNEDENKEIGQAVPATKSDHKVLEPAAEAKPEVPKKVYGPPEKRERNMMGDYVVTKIEIPDLVVPKLEEAAKDSDESEESEEEPATMEEVKEEPKAPVK